MIETEILDRGYSARRFLNNLQLSRGGDLYMRVDLNLSSRLTDIIPRAHYALNELIRIGKEGKTITSEPQLQGKDVIDDFLEVFKSGTPHPDRALDRVHLLADWMCRDHLIEASDSFLRFSGGLTPEHFPIKDDFPFSFVGPDSIAFQTDEKFPNIIEYFNRAIDLRSELVDSLSLTGDDKERFKLDFEDSFEEILEAIFRNLRDNDEDLHPLVDLAADLMELGYGLKQL